jgi:hypothetical protein
VRPGHSPENLPSIGRDVLRRCDSGLATRHVPWRSNQRRTMASS